MRAAGPPRSAGALRRYTRVSDRQDAGLRPALPGKLAYGSEARAPGKRFRLTLGSGYTSQDAGRRPVVPGKLAKGGPEARAPGKLAKGGPEACAPGTLARGGPEACAPR